MVVLDFNYCHLDVYSLTDLSTVDFVCVCVAGELVRAYATPRGEVAVLGRGQCAAHPHAMQHLRRRCACKNVC